MNFRLREDYSRSGDALILELVRSTVCPITQRKMWKVSVYLFVCLSFSCLLVCLFVCLFLFACLLACLFACLFVCFLVCLSVRSFVCLLVRLFVCFLVCLFYCSFVHSFVCSFVCLFVCFFFENLVYSIISLFQFFVCFSVCLFLFVCVHFLFICTQIETHTKKRKRIPVYLFESKIRHKSTKSAITRSRTESKLVNPLLCASLLYTGNLG